MGKAKFSETFKMRKDGFEEPEEGDVVYVREGLTIRKGTVLRTWCDNYGKFMLVVIVELKRSRTLAVKFFGTDWAYIPTDLLAKGEKTGKPKGDEAEYAIDPNRYPESERFEKIDACASPIAKAYGYGFWLRETNGKEFALIGNDGCIEITDLADEREIAKKNSFVHRETCFFGKKGKKVLKINGTAKNKEKPIITFLRKTKQFLRLSL